MKTFQYKFTYTKDEYNLIIKSGILGNRGQERKIFNLLLSNCTVKQIAKKTGYSERTIQRRRREIWWKIHNFLTNTNSKQNVTHKPYGYGKSHDYTKPKYYVYLLIFPNDKVYIGQSLDPKTRWQNGNGYKNNKDMYYDIKKYGWENIKKQIVYSNLSYEESLEKEKELIINYKSNIPKFGYNKDL